MDTEHSASSSSFTLESQQGYLKLIGEHFNHILSPSSSHPSSPPELILGRKLAPCTPDVFAIAADKNISRQHARIHWASVSSPQSPPSASSPGCWYITCVGKNGMFVDDQFLSGNESMKMEWKHREFIKMQIGDVIFFVIQPIQQQNNNNNTSMQQQSTGSIS